MQGEIKIDGLKELRANMLKLTDRTQRNVLNRSVNAGARVIRDQARQNAPRDEGNLAKNIITKKRRAPKGAANYEVMVRGINPKIGNSDNSMKTNDPKNSFYGRFVEFGTSKMQARPFMAPAFENRKREALDAIKKSLGEGIEKEAAKEGVRL